VLESDWLYVGKPARKLAPLDQRLQDMIAFTIWTYCQYSQAFNAAGTRAAADRGLGRALLRAQRRRNGRYQLSVLVGRYRPRQPHPSLDCPGS
jgi:hypothetical protein